jgi:hypothetical protein
VLPREGANPKKENKPMNDKLFNNYNFLGAEEEYSKDDEEQAVELDVAQNYQKEDPSQR